MRPDRVADFKYAQVTSHIFIAGRVGYLQLQCYSNNQPRPFSKQRAVGVNEALAERASPSKSMDAMFLVSEFD